MFVIVRRLNLSLATMYYNINTCLLRMLQVLT